MKKGVFRPQFQPHIGGTMKVAVLGAGAGGAASVAELVLAGHDVSFWGRSEPTIAPHVDLGGVAYEGKLGAGIAKPMWIGTNLAEAIAGVDVAVVALPTFSHSGIATALSKAGWLNDKLVVLNPGHTGGALEFSESFRIASGRLPAVVEFSTLTYVARKYRPDGVTVTGRAKQVRAASLNCGRDAVSIAATLFPGAEPVADVLAADLSNVNMILHPPGAILSAAWVEATSGNFTFYVDAMTPAVARVMRLLDSERLAVAKAFGHILPNVIDEMRLIGTVEANVDANDYVAAISGGEANRKIKAPASLEHRYYREDFGHGLLPFLVLAEIARVETPVAESLYRLAQAAVGVDHRIGGRTAEAMGISGFSKDALLQRVTAR